MPTGHFERETFSTEIWVICRKQRLKSNFLKNLKDDEQNLQTIIFTDLPESESVILCW
jgi:hypothetical protein